MQKRTKMKVVVGIILIMMVVIPLLLTTTNFPIFNDSQGNQIFETLEQGDGGDGDGDDGGDDPDDAPTPDDDDGTTGEDDSDDFWGWIAMPEFGDEPFFFFILVMILLMLLFGCCVCSRCCGRSGDVGGGACAKRPITLTNYTRCEVEMAKDKFLVAVGKKKRKRK